MLALMLFTIRRRRRARARIFLLLFLVGPLALLTVSGCAPDESTEALQPAAEILPRDRPATPPSADQSTAPDHRQARKIGAPPDGVHANQIPAEPRLHQTPAEKRPAQIQSVVSKPALTPAVRPSGPAL
jgi:hypothetical protein